MKTDNMKRAVCEMFGIGSAEPAEVLIIEETKNAAETMMASPAKEVPVVPPESPALSVPVASPVVSLRPVSYLAADAIWEGNLRSDGDVDATVKVDEAFAQIGELADKVGFTMANVSLLKNGKIKALKISTLDKLCRVLDCQPGDLLEYTEGEMEDEDTV